jgi:serine/threonine protein kinase
MSGPHDLTGRTLDGRYRVTKLLGQGGMGYVYEAVHVALGRKVAIKTLHPRLAYEERFRERFIREAKSASSIQHPNVVQIMDFGDTPDGSVYFVMEHLEGRDLGSLLREHGKLPWARTRAILLQAVRALAAAHAQSVVHRDIKPANCFLTTTGAGHQEELVKLLDFGIAKVGTEAEGGDGGPRLTGTGEVFGTASYMAPEQARGEALDARSDLYSLGIMAYEMLTGQVPFTGINSLHVITKHLMERPKPPRMVEPGIPPAVETVVLRAIAKEAKDRFASMVELEGVLSGISADARAPARGRVTTGSARPVGVSASTGVSQAAKGGASAGAARVASTSASTRSEAPVKGVGAAGVGAARPVTRSASPKSAPPGSVASAGAGQARPAMGNASPKSAPPGRSVAPAGAGQARPATGSASPRSVPTKGGGVSSGSDRPAIGSAPVGSTRPAQGSASGRPNSPASSVRPNAPPPRSGLGVGAASRGAPPKAVPPPAARMAPSSDAVPSSRSHARTEPAEDAPARARSSPPGTPMVLPSAARDPSFRSGSISGVPQVLPSAAHDPSRPSGSHPGVPQVLPSAAHDSSYPSHPSLAVPRPLAASDVSGELGRGFASGPIAVDTTGQSTVPPPGQLDQTTSPSISLRASSQTGSSTRMTGPNAADTSPHRLRSPSASRSARPLALVLGAIALVSVGSIAATLAVLRGGNDAPSVEDSNPQEIQEVAVPATSRDESEPDTPGSGTDREVEANAVPTPSEAATPLDDPSRDTSAAGPIEGTVVVSDVVIEPNDVIEPDETSEPDDASQPDDASEPDDEELADEQPTDDAPSPTTKRPAHLTQPCIDRRARAQAALHARAWKDLLSATSKAWCWPLAEQDARRGMRVWAHLELGDLDACIASGRGVKDKKTREAVKTCEELRAR